MPPRLVNGKTVDSQTNGPRNPRPPPPVVEFPDPPDRRVHPSRLKSSSKKLCDCDKCEGKGIRFGKDQLRVHAKAQAVVDLARAAASLGARVSHDRAAKRARLNDDAFVFDSAGFDRHAASSSAPHRSAASSRRPDSDSEVDELIDQEDVFEGDSSSDSGWNARARARICSARALEDTLLTARASPLIVAVVSLLACLLVPR